MKLALTSVAARSYAALRRLVRAVVLRSPILDRVVGDRLRRLEQHMPVDAIFREIADRNYGECHGFELEFPANDMGTVASILLHGDYEPETREAVTPDGGRWMLKNRPERLHDSAPAPALDGP